jgi:hypothetical protein
MYSMARHGRELKPTNHLEAQLHYFTLIWYSDVRSDLKESLSTISPSPNHYKMKKKKKKKKTGIITFDISK